MAFFNRHGVALFKTSVSKEVLVLHYLHNSQAFIQAVLLMSVFEQILSFEML